MASKRVLGMGVVAVAAVLGMGASVVPAGAVVGTGQARPQVVSKAEPVPGTARNVTLVSHLAPGKTVSHTTPAGQYAALAIAGNCAYIGRRNYNSTDNADNGLGVQVVNIANPAAPRYLGDIPGSGFVDSTARELRAVEQYHLLVVMHYSRYTGGGVDAAGHTDDGRLRRIVVVQIAHEAGAGEAGHALARPGHVAAQRLARPDGRLDESMDAIVGRIHDHAQLLGDLVGRHALVGRIEGRPHRPGCDGIDANTFVGNLACQSDGEGINRSF